MPRRVPEQLHVGASAAAVELVVVISQPQNDVPRKPVIEHRDQLNPSSQREAHVLIILRKQQWLLTSRFALREARSANNFALWRRPKRGEEVR